MKGRYFRCHHCWQVQSTLGGALPIRVTRSVVAGIGIPALEYELCGQCALWLDSMMGGHEYHIKRARRLLKEQEKEANQ